MNWGSWVLTAEALRAFVEAYEESGQDPEYAVYLGPKPASEEYLAGKQGLYTLYPDGVVAIYVDPVNYPVEKGPA